MNDNFAILHKDDVIKIHFEEILGDSTNISFSPQFIGGQFAVGDEIKIDFNSAEIEVIEKHSNHSLARVVTGGKVGSNKATNVKRELPLDPITPKDKQAISIGRKMGIRHFALSFAGSVSDVQLMRETAGADAHIISKIESRKGLHNLDGILDESDEILIDRGDLSREVSLEKIPFLQRRIISTARGKGVPVYVATNLLESMRNSKEPTRAEINDVVSTLLMGANGLVLAAETAIGDHPYESVRMIRLLINQFNKWTPNTTIDEILTF